MLQPRSVRAWLGATALSGIMAIAPTAEAQGPVAPSLPGAPRPTPQPEIPTQKPETPSDAAFVMDASATGAREVALGKLASMRAASSIVREFASMMVTDHSKANAELQALAAGKGWELAKAVPADADQTSLEREGGRAFDRAYIDMMVKGHDHAVTAFERQAQSGMDLELKAWAQKMLPVIRDHHTRAKDVRAALDKTTSH